MEPSRSSASERVSSEAERIYLRHRGEGRLVPVDDLCAEHPALADQLRRLHVAWGWLDQWCRGDVEDERGVQPVGWSGPTAERYVEREKIGRGGMGTVYRVLDRHLQRRLALKVISGASSASADAPPSSPRSIFRFLREARVMARLDHPGVVPIHDVATDVDGRPFFTMQLVQGEDLAHVIEARRSGTSEWTLARLVGVLVRVCQTVDYAHSRGVTHRDLKPSNVMVGRFGQVYVVDWGLAHTEDVVEDEYESGELVATLAEDEELLTLEGQVLGTPGYMPPEQAHGDRSRVGVQFDVYAIGAILYHVLCGVPPYAEELERSGTTGALVAVWRGPPRPVRALAPRTPRELVAICERAMARDPSERYTDARALGDDLQAFLEGRVVLADRTGPLVRARKWVARNPRLALFEALSVAVLVVLVVVQTRARIAIGGERDRTELESYVASISAADAALRIHDVPEARLRLERAPQELRDWEWRHLAARLDQSLATYEHHPHWATSVAFSPDGQLLLTTGREGGACVVRLSDGALLRRFTGHAGAVNDAVFLAGGARVASAGEDGCVRVWDTDTGAELRVFGPYGQAVFALAAFPDGRRLVAGCDDRTVRVLDAETGAASVSHEHSTNVLAVAVSPDGASVASGCQLGELVLRSLDDGRERWRAELPVKVQTLAFHPGGEWLAVDGEKLLVLETATGAPVASWSTREAGGGGFQAFTPDGDGLVLCGADRSVRTWDWRGDRQLGALRGHLEPVIGAAVSPDGRRIATACFDGTVKLWDTRVRGDVQVLEEHRGYAEGLAFDAAGVRFATVGRGPAVHLWDTDSGALLASLTARSDVFDAAFAPDGRTLALADRDGYVTVLDVATGEHLRRLELFPGGTPHGAWTRSVAFDPTGAWLAAGRQDGTLRLWETTGWSPAATLQRSAPVRAVAFHPTAERLAVAGDDHLVVLHALPDLTAVRTLEGHGAPVYAVAFAPDGRSLASGSLDRTARMWDLASGTSTVLEGHSRELEAVAFSPDGRRLLTAGRDRQLLLWDTATLREVARLRGHSWWVFDAAFSPSGDTIVSVGKDRTVRVWRTD